MEKKHQYDEAYRESLRNYQLQSPEKMSDLTLCQFKEGFFEVPYIGDLVKVSYPSGEMFSQKRPLTLEDKIIILQYLAEASPATLQDKWISFLQLPGGPLHHDPFVKVAQGAFERTFGKNKNLFLAKAEEFDAKPIKLSTEGLLFKCLPKIPVVVQLWEEDEEFPAKCNILFDSSAALHLQTATIFVLGLRLALIVCKSNSKG